LFNKMLKGVSVRRESVLFQCTVYEECVAAPKADPFAPRANPEGAGAFMPLKNSSQKGRLQTRALLLSSQHVQIRQTQHSRPMGQPHHRSPCSNLPDLVVAPNLRFVTTDGCGCPILRRTCKGWEPQSPARTCSCFSAFHSRQEICFPAKQGAPNTRQPSAKFPGQDTALKYLTHPLRGITPEKRKIKVSHKLNLKQPASSAQLRVQIPG